MGLIVKPYTFTSGILAKAVEANADFDTAYNVLNGKLDSANFSACFTIGVQNLDMSGGWANQFTIDEPHISITDPGVGTAGGSAGNSTHCAAQKVIEVLINGTPAYIPIFTQNT